MNLETGSVHTADGWDCETESGERLKKAIAHRWKSRKMKMVIGLKCNPAPAQVAGLRTSIQAKRELGITAAQDYCAELVHTSRRSWQQWERGERKMHPAFWELARIKVSFL